MFDIRITPTTDIEVLNFCNVSLHKYWQSSVSNRIVLVQQNSQKWKKKRALDRFPSSSSSLMQVQNTYDGIILLLFTIHNLQWQVNLVDYIFLYFFFSLIFFIHFVLKGIWEDDQALVQGGWRGCGFWNLTGISWVTFLDCWRVM